VPAARSLNTLVGVHGEGQLAMMLYWMQIASGAYMARACMQHTVEKQVQSADRHAVTMD